MRRLFSLVVVLACSHLLPGALPVAHAQEVSVAKEQFIQAKKRYEKGDFAGALTLFQVAWEHSGSPNARLYIARCFRGLKKMPAAYDEFKGALRDSVARAREDQKYLKTRDAAAAELALLELEVGRLVVTVDERVSEAKVAVNGKALHKVNFGHALTVSPGQVTITAEANGQQLEKKVSVSPGQTASVGMVFTIGDPSGDGQPVPVQGGAADDGPLTTLELVGVISLGVGGLLVAGGAASGAAAASKFSALDSACGDQPCPDPVFNDIVDSGKTFELMAYIGLGAGAAAMITGGALLLFAGDDGSGADTAAGFAPLPGGGFATYRTSF